MFYLTQRDHITLILDGAALLLIFGILMYSPALKRREREDDRWFLRMLVANIVVALSDVVGYLFGSKDVPGYGTICMIGMTIFYLAFVILTMAWSHYTRVRFADGGQDKQSVVRASNIPGSIMLVLILINFFTGWIFMCDEHNVYHRGFLFIPMYLVMIFYVAKGFVYVSKYRDKSSGRPLIPLGVYVLPVIVGVVLTFVIPGNASFAPIGIAMSFSFTHFGTINEIKT